MEFPSVPQPVIRPFWRRPGALAAAGALVLYVALLAKFIVICAGGSDSSGYLNHAKLLGSGHVHAPVRVLEGLPEARAPGYLYTPLGFKPASDGNSLVPTYASGFPLLIAAAAKLVGWSHAGDVVVILHAVLGLLLTYALGRALLLSPSWAFLGAAIMAVSPLYLEYSLQAMSDMPSLAWVAAAVLAAWRGGRREAGGGRQAMGGWWAAGAGAALAIAVLIRPTNVIALAPVAVALGLSPRRWLALILGGLPGAVFFCLDAKAAYGSFLATGYGDTWSSFSTAFVPGTLLHYLRWLPAIFTPVVLLAIGLPWYSRTAPRAAAVLGAWALAYLAFYAAYYNTHETWWYLRFLLPAAPALVVGGLLVARQISAKIREPLLNAIALAAVFYAVYHGTHETARHLRFVLPAIVVGGLLVAHHIAMRTRGRAWTFFAAALALVLANGAWWVRKLDVLSTGRMELTYPRAMAWLDDHLPADAVLAVMQTSGAVLYYTPFTFVRWDELDPGTFPQIVAAARVAHRPIYAVLFSFESEEALKGHIPGAWSRYGAVGDVTIWRLNGE